MKSTEVIPPAFSAELPFSESRLVSRFSIAILSCLLLSMGIGSLLPSECVELAFATGTVGLIAYLACSYRASVQQRVLQKSDQERQQFRLSYFTSRRLLRFMASIRQHEPAATVPRR